MYRSQSLAILKENLYIAKFWDIWDIWDIFILLFETFKKNKKGKKEKEESRIIESLK